MPRTQQIKVDDIAPGTQRIVSRRGYRHHGTYVGSGRVIHCAGRLTYPHGLIEEVSLTKFIEDHPCRIGGMPGEEITGKDVARRASSRLGKRCDDLFRNNSGQFCNRCLMREQRSAQVESLTWLLRLLLRSAQKLVLLITSSTWTSAKPEGCTHGAVRCDDYRVVAK
jgi:hypothetical protein